MSTEIKVKPKVLALMPFKAIEEDYLNDFKSQFILHELKVSNHDEAIAAIKSHVAESGPYAAFAILMGTGPFESFTPEFFSALQPHCKIIVSASAGYNKFPIDWMTQNGIWFCNTRHAFSEPTADMAMFLTLAVIRDTSRAEKSARAGLWRSDHVPATDPSGLKLGIIGMGAIGKHHARKASVFNMDIQYYNRRQLPREDEIAYNATYCATLEELLKTSDVISVSCPLDATTKGLLSHKEFSQMKDGVFLVNTARGAIIDEGSLIAALESGKVARAGLDVFEDEPRINPYFIESDRCIIQPHLGGFTKNARRDAEKECLENIKSLISTGRPVAPVNEISHAK